MTSERRLSNIYVINLDRNPERLASISRQFLQQSLAFVRVSAWDGSLMDEVERDEWMSEHTRGGKGWLPGQIGCFRSHCVAWAHAAEYKRSFSLVLEDDVHLSDDLGCLLADLQWVPSDADLVSIETAPNSLKLGPSYAVPNVARELRELRSAAWAAGAYLIRGDVAAWLLAAPSRLHAPTDFFLFDVETSPIARALAIMQLCPAAAVQDKFAAYNETERYGFLSDVESVPLKSEAVQPVWRLCKCAVRKMLGRRVVRYSSVVRKRT